MNLQQYRRNYWLHPKMVALIAVTILSIVAMLWPSFSGAAVEEAEPIAPATPCVLNIATGKSGKGYANVFQDIKAICGQTVSVCEVPTTGGLKNLMSLASNEADLGMVQIDTLKDMSNGDDNLKTLQAVVPVGINLLHIVTLANGYTVQTVAKGQDSFAGLMKGKDVVTNTQAFITQFSDFKNVKRPIALVGTAQLMGRTLDRTLGYGMNFVDVDDDKSALGLLKTGKVVAVFTVSAWPNGELKDLTPSSGYTLVRYDLMSQGDYKVVKKPYPRLNIYNMPFLAVPNLLVTRPFRASGANGQNVAALQACLTKALPDLKDGRYQPAWKDIASMDETYGWTRFTPPASPVKNTLSMRAHVR